MQNAPVPTPNGNGDTMRVCVEFSRKKPGAEPFSSVGYVVRIEMPVRPKTVADLRVIADELRGEAERLVDGWFAMRNAARGAGT